MKRLTAVLLVLALSLLLCSCGRTIVDQDAQVTLTFVYEDREIHAALEDSEAARVLQILDGKRYDPSVWIGYPSCGFSENISLVVGDRCFAIARDTCNCIWDFGSGLYFDIPQEDMAYIHSLFQQYGGYFPCI